ncbi:Resuscitation-promoting factor RpfA, partial [Mycobacterium lacus]|nr:Resuscitation-promoting factor RpfA [Mycobacterium lacus]
PAPPEDLPPAPPEDLTPPAPGEQPAPPEDLPPAPPEDLTPPAPGEQPAPDAPSVIEAGSQSPELVDVPLPAPDEDQNPPVEIHQVSTVAFTKQVWQAIRAQDVSGNDALDALAQPSSVIG